MTLPKVLAMRIKCRKGLISYHKFNGIMAMKKHVEFCHDALLKIFLKDEAFEVPKSPLYCEPSKKRANVSPSNIFGFLLIALSSKKMTQHNQVLWRISCCLFVKRLLPMRTMESIWLPNLVKKTMITYAIPTLANYLSITYTFDLWMSKGAHDVFAYVVNFISSDLEANHVTIGLFEVIDISSATMAPKL